MFVSTSIVPIHLEAYWMLLITKPRNGYYPLAVLLLFKEANSVASAK